MSIRSSLLLVLLALSLLPRAVVAADTDPATRRAYRAALDAARHGKPGEWQTLASGLEDYALYPYIEHAALTRDLRQVDDKAVENYLRAWDGSWTADDLRARWLRVLGGRAQWQAFEADWRGQRDTELQCHHLTARLNLDQREGLADAAIALWLSPTSSPSACDDLITWLRQEKRITPELAWRRIAAAAEQRQSRLITAIARDLPTAQQTEAARWSRVIADPGRELAQLDGKAFTADRQRLATLAMTQLARRDHARAAALWPVLEGKFKFSAEQSARMLGAIALWKAANYAPDASAWMARVPWDQADDATREWRVREALTRGDYPAATRALGSLSTAQQLDSRWRYLRARLLELDGQTAAAAAAFATVANEPTFHGFLAADRVDRDYTLCPLEPSREPTAVARVSALPGLQRALELRAIDETEQARREWDHTLSRLSTEDRVIAVDLAIEHGWRDRGPLTLLRPEESRYYSLRFPLAYRKTINARARQHGLDPSWILGIIRAESAWARDARSGANARGLMQVLPSVAAGIARAEHIPYRDGNDLYVPRTNLALGTRHMADVLSRYDGRLWLATAAYNAGPTPVSRWLGQRGQLPVDIFIETIPYRETREYVARVLAFSLIYDWRLRGTAASLGAKLGLNAPPASRRGIVCAVTAGATEATKAGAR